MRDTQSTAQTPTPSYIPVLQLLGSVPSEVPTPAIDAVTFQYLGITVHAYGVLHGLTGGTNRDYVQLVNKTIAQAPGYKLGEKEMSKLYRGLDGELHDWIQMPARDAFRAGLSLVGTPSRLVSLARCALKELATRRDKALAQPHVRLQDLGGSPLFHAIAPFERRKLAGFIPPAAYLKENLARRRGTSRLAAPAFPDRDWLWLNYIEPYTNIAIRSVHMLHYAAMLAQEKHLNEISLFVGEIHNTDMQWFASATLTEFNETERRDIGVILQTAEDMARRVTSGRLPRMRQILYLSCASAGVSLPLAIYAIALKLGFEALRYGI